MEYSSDNIDLFISERDDVSLKNLRYSLWIISICLILFGLVDPLLSQEKRHEIFLIRFGVIVPVVLACSFLSHSEIFSRIRSIVVLIVPICVSVGFVSIMMLEPQNENLQFAYTQGLLIAVSFAPAMLTLSPRNASIFIIITLVGFNSMALKFYRIQDEDIAMYISSNTLLIMAGILGIFMRVITLRLFLKNISKAKIIERERDTIQEQMQKQSRIMDQLIDSRKKLAQSSEIKNKLLSLIAHDIKGPLASVRGIVEMFSKGLLTNKELEQQSEKLSFLLSSTNNMLSNLLSWSIVHMDEASIKKELIDLNAAVSENFKLIHDQAEAKNNQLINKVPELYHTKADPSVLNLVLRNLISNAVKFTDGGKIVVSAYNFGVSTIINVSDTGIGMIPEQLDKLFNWEDRRSSMGTRLEKGSGIGLLISKDFAEKHGGKLLVKSAKSKGTTFSLVLPAG